LAWYFYFWLLVLHIINFTIKIKFGTVPKTAEGIDDTFKLVVSLFDIWWYDIIYIISFIALGLHLHHAFGLLFKQ
jgi:succinate dehydrogenase / fumarate reductase cytochrome b subunit